MPYLWASTTDPETLAASFPEDPSVERVRSLSAGDAHRLYAVDWTAAATRLVDRFAETDGSVLDARGTADRWEFRIQFPDRATASATVQTWRDGDVDPSISSIGILSSGGAGKGGLSPIQHSTTAHAFETNYYEVPPGATLEELARGYEVTHQALSERLRRGHANLVEQMLSESPGGAEPRP